MITAAACKRKGMEVLVFEKVAEYKPFGGPIQLQCNSQGALDSIDPAMAEEVFEEGLLRGSRERIIRWSFWRVVLQPIRAAVYMNACVGVGIVEIRFVGHFTGRRWKREHHDGDDGRVIRTHEGR